MGHVAGQRAQAVQHHVPDDPHRRARPARHRDGGLRRHLLAVAVVPADPGDSSARRRRSASGRRCRGGPQRRDRRAVGGRHRSGAAARVRRPGAGRCRHADRPAHRRRRERGRGGRVRRREAAATRADQPADQVADAAARARRRIRGRRRNRAAADRRPSRGLPGGRGCLRQHAADRRAAGPRRLVRQGHRVRQGRPAGVLQQHHEGPGRDRPRCTRSRPPSGCT